MDRIQDLAIRILACFPCACRHDGEEEDASATGTQLGGCWLRDPHTRRRRAVVLTWKHRCGGSRQCAISVLLIISLIQKQRIREMPAVGLPSFQADVRLVVSYTSALLVPYTVKIGERARLENEE